ncbi:hypothetical protein Taro_030276 [Colocasia esculenta]|uniref:Uncharacterized protein n=1 Tax=Colocasia esculenta TaxID=4460 RepID=A0A843VL19_COLES|nr:hypothetical protein [Colocasia esculenta]
MNDQANCNLPKRLHGRYSSHQLWPPLSPQSPFQKVEGSGGCRCCRTGHDDGEAEELGRGTAHEGDGIAEGAADGGAEKDIDGDEPPEAGAFKQEFYHEKLLKSKAGQ